MTLVVENYCHGEEAKTVMNHELASEKAGEDTNFSLDNKTPHVCWRHGILNEPRVLSVVRPVEGMSTGLRLHELLTRSPPFILHVDSAGRAYVPSRHRLAVRAVRLHELHERLHAMLGPAHVRKSPYWYRTHLACCFMVLLGSSSVLVLPRYNTGFR